MRAIETLMAEGHQERFTPEGRILVRSVQYSDSATNALFMDDLSEGELHDHLDLTDEERAEFEQWLDDGGSVLDDLADMARDRGVAS